MLIPISLTLEHRLTKHTAAREAIPPASENAKETSDPKSNADRQILVILTAHAPFLSPKQTRVSATAFESPNFTPGRAIKKPIDSKFSR